MTDIGPARLDDIAALMSLERGEGYEHVVGRWSAEQHAAEMALPGSHYRVARGASGAPRGFVMLQRLDDPDLCAHLRRIAVAQAGRRLGRRAARGGPEPTFSAPRRRIGYSFSSIPRTSGRAGPTHVQASLRKACFATSDVSPTAVFAPCW